MSDNCREVVRSFLQQEEMLNTWDRRDRAKIYGMWAGREDAFISFKEMANESTELMKSSNCVYSDSDRGIIHAANERVQKMNYSTFLVLFNFPCQIKSVEVASGGAFPIKVPGSKTVFFAMNKVPTIE